MFLDISGLRNVSLHQAEEYAPGHAEASIGMGPLESRNRLRNSCRLQIAVRNGPYDMQHHIFCQKTQCLSFKQQNHSYEADPAIDPHLVELAGTL